MVIWGFRRPRSPRHFRRTVTMISPWLLATSKGLLVSGACCSSRFSSDATQRRGVASALSLPVSIPTWDDSRWWLLVEFCFRKLIDFGLGRPVTAERREIISTTSSHADPCSMFFFFQGCVCMQDKQDMQRHRYTAACPPMLCRESETGEWIYSDTVCVRVWLLAYVWLCVYHIWINIYIYTVNIYIVNYLFIH